MRVIRILVYEGTEEWINAGLKNRGVKGSIETTYGKISETFFYPGDAPGFDEEDPE